ncbi:MAG: aminomethyl-transferring glycine dehydrogenase subunit GcvPA [Gammaproteobacteria bacterium]|jgi:glycine dehydrogenase subunit 1|nr:aminomethyl-transferring glycine dehydrogenase subunit GcvPA [Gammaproteobacteria bacterium]MDP6616728.1 aminomethyl-transferring glycine dehydrogenase subunit GcvPA [Gammaproteobacteria bacterium]MDP6695207.1 aminomethyl-transferring glycine dehydrogenase subunit GcvPA [Gammaproteobacteria bacterium]MDP7041046.1 aminomethyl-transferring glycine dehydrogenase subunit GcvPA [Gammaproteobacteria bacterium]
MPFVPHTESDISAMLARLGVADIADLFDEIPAGLRIKGLEGIGPALSEADISRLMQTRARQDGEPLCFTGAGAYDHYVPAAVWDIATRGEFYSAYTPYQAEASQGTLQVIYEFQTMLASLTGLDVSNASLYDGATAFAEACLMAVRANRRNRSRKILVSRTLSPACREVARVMLKGQQIELVELAIRDGVSDSDALNNLSAADFAAVAIQNPNFLGSLDAVDVLTDWAHSGGALVIGVANPMALALLKPPGQWGAAGADIACGEGQPMGIPMSSGGPYFGYLVCRQDIVRQMPGRIVGRTVDLEGKPGFTLTLQAREQHIRRSRATSNICTNQGLVATAATIYMSLMGASGLRSVATKCNANTNALVDALTALPGVTRAFAAPFFHEAVLTFDRPVAGVLDTLSSNGILGGYDLSADYPELGNALLVCATEMRSATDISAYAGIASEIFGAAA